MADLETPLPAAPEAQDQDDSAAPVTPEFEPGVLASWDYTPEEIVYPDDLSAACKGALHELCVRFSERDTAARRTEVIQAWEAGWFERGYHRLLSRRGGGWMLPAERGYDNGQKKGGSFYETNFYGAYLEIIEAALCRENPVPYFEPADPESDADITAADAANRYKDVFVRDSDLMGVQTDMCGFAGTDGRFLTYTSHVLDAQQFGFEEAEDESGVVPENEMQENVEQAATIQAIEAVDPTIAAVEEEFEQTGTPVAGTAKPRGREVARVYGKLYHKVPFNSNKLEECYAVSLCREFDESTSRSRYPWIADKVKPGAMGAAQNQLDRIARTNLNCGIVATYVTGDSQEREVTEAYFWFRPSAYMSENVAEECRAELFDMFPSGVLIVYAGDTMAFCRNECMDDHLTLTHILPGKGMNRVALGTKMLSSQKRLNVWIDLMDDFFRRTIAQKIMDNVAFNIEQLKNQPNLPGGIIPFQRQPGVPITELFAQETTPQPQPALPEFINKFSSDVMQMLSGALPSLFGENANTETVGGISIQRDQALGRMGSPWHALQSAFANIHRQAVQLAARCREKKISSVVPGMGKIEIELSDLKGNVRCYPDTSDLPETRAQRKAFFLQMLTAKDPMVQQFFNTPKNLKEFKDAMGFKAFEIPQAAAVEKQLGEFELLKKTGPIDNPQLLQAQQMLGQIQQSAEATGEHLTDPRYPVMMQQAQQMMGAIPPLVSTVPIDNECDDHKTEEETCMDWVNSPEGRKYKNGTPQEKAAFANIRLHGLEHRAQKEALMAKAAAMAQQQKVAESLAFKDLPPSGQIQEAQQAGIKLLPQDVGQGTGAPGVAAGSNPSPAPAAKPQAGPPQ